MVVSSKEATRKGFLTIFNEYELRQLKYYREFLIEFDAFVKLESEHFGETTKAHNLFFLYA